MHLLDHEKLIKQIIPPHWRATWRERLIRSLMEPIIQDYQDLYEYINDLPTLVNRNSQVLVMEENLNRIAGHLTRLIFIDDGEDNGVFIVNIPINEPALIEIRDYLNTYTIAGSEFIINEYD